MLFMFWLFTVKHSRTYWLFSLLSNLIHSTKKTELHQLLSTTNNSSFKELRNKVHLVYKQSPLVIYKVCSLPKQFHLGHTTVWNSQQSQFLGWQEFIIII